VAPGEREILEHAVHAVTAPAAKADDLVDEPSAAGLAEDRVRVRREVPTPFVRGDLVIAYREPNL
jgi:hypothetical protein